MDTTTTTLATRKSTLIPPKAVGSAKIAGVIDALRLDTRLTAATEYQAIVDALLPSVSGINNTAEPVLHGGSFIEDAVLKGARWASLPLRVYSR